jgi:Ca2+-binding RTX toxin-like protein
MRCGLGGVVAVAVALVAAPAAGAAVLQVETHEATHMQPDRVVATYRASLLERNDVTVEVATGEHPALIFWDAGARIYFADDDTQTRCYIGATTAAICPIDASDLPVVTLFLGDGADQARVTMPNGLYTFHGGAGADRLFGNAVVSDFCGTLRGDHGDDRLAGGPGCETLVGGLGADEMAGGDGSDSADYREISAGQTNQVPVWRPNGTHITLDDLSGDGAPGEDDNVRSDVEIVFGTNNDDVIVGSTADNTLYSSLGGDDLDGGPGDDLLVGTGGSAGSPSQADGPNRLKGGPGRDTLFGGNADDVLDTRDGEADKYLCEGGHDLLTADVFDVRYIDSLPNDCEQIEVG